jgi:hypothetical protein
MESYCRSRGCCENEVAHPLAHTRIALMIVRRYLRYRDVDLSWQYSFSQLGIFEKGCCARLQVNV